MYSGSAELMGDAECSAGTAVSPTAIIFDCDGVLVDSELIVMEVGQRVLAELGWEVPLDRLLEMFMGCSHEYYLEQVRAHTGLPLEEGWDERYRPWYGEALRARLQPVDGIAEAIDQLTLPIAVASNSRRTRIRESLRLTGLLGHFEGRIASAEDVPEGKPAPDVYLRAAAILSVDPRRCLAVEDTHTGATAALAAGMRVIAYETAHTPAGSFDGRDVVRIHSMRELPALVHRLMKG